MMTSENQVPAAPLEDNYISNAEQLLLGVSKNSVSSVAVRRKTASPDEPLLATVGHLPDEANDRHFRDTAHRE